MKYFLFLIFLSFATSTIAQKIYYVSSSTGNDSNSGTSSTLPWKTLDKANSIKLAPGDKLLLKRGDMWEGTITINGSGTESNPVMLAAYGSGANPIIYGSKKVTGWSLHKGKIYKAKVGGPVSQVFVDDTRIGVARYPNSGYAYTDPVSSASKLLVGGLANDNCVGATCISRSMAYRFYSKKVVSSVSGLLTLESTPTGGMSASKGFILVNKLCFLDQPGEWYYDQSSGMLYVWAPKGDNPANHTIRASTVDNGVYSNGRSHVIIKNLNLNHFAKSGIYCYNSRNVTIDNCSINYAEAYGIQVRGGNQSYYTITNNKIKGANAEGIVVYATYSTIENNQVADIALLENLGMNGSETSSGIRFVGSNITCRYNRISNVGYNGIFWQGVNANISFNYINGACKVLDDGGGIYTWSGDYASPGSAGSVVDHNIILNVIGNRTGYRSKPDFGYGIYIDQRIHGVKVTNNTIQRVSGGIILNMDTGSNLVDGNTVMNFAMAMQVGKTREVAKVTNNIFYATQETYDFTWWKTKPQRIFRLTHSKPTTNNNRYVSHYHATELFDSNSDGYFESFEQWKRGTSQDAQSTIDVTPLAAGATETLFFNDTKAKKSINLGTSVYKDVYGNTVSGTIILAPFTSKILVKSTLKSAKISNQSIATSQPVRGEVGNNSRSSILLLFDETLGEENIPQPADFTASNKTVVEVSLKGAEIYLGLDSDYLPEEEIFVSYQSGQMPLKDASGRTVGSFTDYPVENRIVVENSMKMMIAADSGNAELTIYPNPSNGVFHVEAGNLQDDKCEVALYSMTGELVAKRILSTAYGSLAEKIDMSHLNRGTYIVHLISEKEIHKGKIIIM